MRTSKTWCASMGMDQNILRSKMSFLDQLKRQLTQFISKTFIAIHNTIPKWDNGKMEVQQ